MTEGNRLPRYARNDRKGQSVIQRSEYTSDVGIPQTECADFVWGITTGALRPRNDRKRRGIATVGYASFVMTRKDKVSLRGASITSDVGIPQRHSADFVRGITTGALRPRNDRKGQSVITRSEYNERRRIPPSLPSLRGSKFICDRGNLNAF